MKKRTSEELWARFETYYTEFPTLDLALDLSRMNFPDDFLARMESELRRAFQSMTDLEAGAIANPDEKRMVGHYWLRHSALAPTPEIRQQIDSTLIAIERFAADVHQGVFRGERGPFRYLLIVGIGGSALGPQFISQALGHPLSDRLEVLFFDNTDPDGMDKVFGRLAVALGETLTVVISKSGGTKETRNGMLEAKTAYERAGLNFARHAIAITGEGSELDRYAEKEGWLRRFPMWDWVGGRTSVMSAVGLLPAALQGFDIRALLAGARECDVVTREPQWKSNPAAQLALMWYYAGGGHGTKDMVVLPYKDRLELFSKYLQQLVMESLGKEFDLNQRRVNQGLIVYGNKGSTDQHAYVQQLREGIDRFFVTFIEVLQDRRGASIDVDPGATTGDYLSGFLLGTRQALYDNGRESVTLTIGSVSPFSVGMLIALYERAVGLYASLIHVNAYHQPGVEAGKKAAGAILALQGKVGQVLRQNPSKQFTASMLAEAVAQPDAAESVFKICQHLARNPSGHVRRIPGRSAGTTSFQSTLP